VHTHKGEVFKVFDLASHFVECGCGPFIERLLLELFLAIPDKSLCPGEATHPIADVVLIAIIDENWKARIEQWS